MWSELRLQVLRVDHEQVLREIHSDDLQSPPGVIVADEHDPVVHSRLGCREGQRAERVVDDLTCPAVRDAVFPRSLGEPDLSHPRYCALHNRGRQPITLDAMVILCGELGIRRSGGEPPHRGRPSLRAATTVTNE